MKFVLAATFLLIAAVALVLVARFAIARLTPQAQNLMHEGRLQNCQSTLKCYQVSVPVTAISQTQNQPTASDSKTANTILQQLIDTALAQPRTELVRQMGNYVHITFKTRWLGYTDDLEVLIDADHVNCKSASRIGRSDLGVNQKRVKHLFNAAGISLEPVH